MIITYDKNPELSVNGKLQSLTESANLALNETSMKIGSLEESYVNLNTAAPAGTVDGDLYRLIVQLGWQDEVIGKK